MKIYKPAPINIVRLMFRNKDKKYLYLNLDETNCTQVFNVLEMLFKENLKVSYKGCSCSIDIREYSGKENKGSKSLGLINIDIVDAYNKVLDYLND